ncbi:cytoplasmic dynein 2 intermediate chain 1-like [Watersipora subatra]|uniref:cytoplasmic dynein 2 intermediate chain 1-like n=1 Tax=Watersipora subatra TaxID=2589382 RepID=UPI00355BC8EB
MPTEKRSKEQTWKEDELKQSIREVHGERSSGKARRDKYGDENKVSKESSHRDKYRDKEGEEHRERRKDKSDSERKRSERDERSRNKPDREEGESRRYRDDRERNGQGRNDDRDDERRSNRRHGRGSDNSERQRHEMDRERRNKGDNYERDERGNDKSDRREHSRRVEDRGQSKRDDSRSRSHRGGDANDRSHGEGDRSKGPRREDKDRGHQEGGRSKGHRSDDRDRGHKGEDRDREHRDRGHRGEDRDREHKDRGHRGEDRDREHKDRGHRGEDRDKEHRERSHRKDDRDRGSEREEKDRGHRGEEQSRRHKDSDRDRGHRKEKDRETHRDDRDREKKDRERGRHHRDDESVHRRKDGERKRRDHNDSEQLDQSYQDRGIRDGDRRESKRRDRDEIDRNQEKHRERDRDDRERHNNDTDRDRRPRYPDKKEEERHHDKDDYKKEKRHRDKTGSEQRQEHKQEASNSAEDGNSKGSRKATVNPQKDNEEDEISYKPRGSAKPVAAQEEDDYGGYDDDFEDYDEDFEDDDGDNDDSVAERVNRMVSCISESVKNLSNSEMEALYDALNAENEKLLADSRSNLSDTPEYQEERYDSRKATSNKPRGFINFVAAKQRDMNQKVASKARKRCTELLNIIELDTVHMTLFDLPPVKEYDLYMSSFGRTNAQQACVQTNEDNLERDTQTEDIDLTTKWTQCPSEGAAACGSADKTNDSSDTSRHDDGKLTAFLQRTCQVIERLLYEEDTKSLYKDTSSEFSCSEASFNLVDVEVFRCRQVSRCYFSPTDSTIILTMHTGPMQAVDRKLDKYGMIGVWNTNDPSAPQKIVASASMPSCCCFSPIKATLVFGGMRDGSLVAWDLREPPTMHHSYICGKTDWLLRFPTYNTAGVLKYDNHSSPITALTPILTDSSKSLSQESGLGLSFQLASLDKNGVVNLWVVAEIHETSMAGSESDLGLSPNGKIKLLKSSTVTLCNPVKNSDLSSLCTVDFKLNPSNHNHFYVGTDSGSIIHGTRFGTKKVSPRCYISDDLTPCKVNSIDLHPFGHPLMLAGCDDGSLKLYHLASESPIIVWENSTGGAAIRRVLWSRNCSYILFVLDSKSTIHMWDLLRNDAEPMTSDSMSRNNLEVTDVCLSEEHAHSRPKMVMSYSNGTVQVHLLSGHVSNLQPGENDQFTRFIDNL